MMFFLQFELYPQYSLRFPYNAKYWIQASGKKLFQP